VPPAWDTGDASLNNILNVFKSDGFYQEQMKPRNDQFRGPDYLRTVSLGELGARIEFTVHNWMHMRFCSQVPAIRPDPDQFSTNIDPKWDNPSYDGLGDTYSSGSREPCHLEASWLGGRQNRGLEDIKQHTRPHTLEGHLGRGYAYASGNGFAARHANDATARGRSR
jgi:hypothetical protein